MKLKDNSEYINKAIDSIISRVNSNQRKWGNQDHSVVEWFLILQEEIGEVTKEICNCNFPDPDQHDGYRLNCLREELLDSAAVIVAMLTGVMQSEDEFNKHAGG